MRDTRRTAYTRARNAHARRNLGRLVFRNTNRTKKMTRKEEPKLCLYPRLIKNRKYLENKKNGGIPPICKDERTRYIAIGCGNCIECRRQKARSWQARLMEEIKTTKYPYFVTLTFTNEALINLNEEIKNSDALNAIAGLAIRRFLERWRKKHKKSVKHWLITELGQTNTERIHLHGVMFCEEYMTNEELTELWKYGKTDIGDYCNARTINYIVKYVTKIDTAHKGYNAQIFCSAGIGRNFLNEHIKDLYRYESHKTNETYRLPNGAKISLPIYYRNHLFTEDEREQLWCDRLDKNTIYVRGIKCDKLNTVQGRLHYERVIREAQEDNIKLGYGDNSKEWKKKDYNLTLKMLNSNKK